MSGYELAQSKTIGANEKSNLVAGTVDQICQIEHGIPTALDNEYTRIFFTFVKFDIQRLLNTIPELVVLSVRYFETCTI